eukprot:10605930-Ditylum_brightwellii.AAC.1
MLVVIQCLRAIEERDTKDEEVRRGKNGCGKHNDQQKFKGKGQGKGGKGKDNSNGKAKEKGSREMKNLCQKHDSKHEWHDCPDNFRNKKKSKNKRKRTKTSRIKSTKRAIIARVAPARTTTCPTTNRKKRQMQKVYCSALRYSWAFLGPSRYSSD